MAQSSAEIQKSAPKSKTGMPDVSHTSRAVVQGKIEGVGMSEIEMPVLWKNETGESYMLPAKINASVNLSTPQAKGIHMSRLYLTLSNSVGKEPLQPSTIQGYLKEFIKTQNGLSDSAYISIGFDLPVRRKALKSNNEGWRQYPVSLSGSLVKGEFLFELAGTVTYSSTCPCSAALARQLIKDKFSKDFVDQEQISRVAVESWLQLETSILATPHSQRSTAEFKIQFSESQFLPNVVELIDQIEEALGTAVQAAVKREDEQEFARLNGQNLMFCEDAGRKVKRSLTRLQQAKGFWVRLTHVESLHPHNAMSVISEGYSETISPH